MNHFIIIMIIYLRPLDLKIGVYESCYHVNFIILLSFFKFQYV